MWQTVVFLSWWLIFLIFIENSTALPIAAQSKIDNNSLKWIILCVVLAAGLVVLVAVIAIICCKKKKMNKLKIMDAGRRTELDAAGEYPRLLADNGNNRDHVLFSKKQEILEKGDGLSESDSSKTESTGEDSLDEERPRHQKTVATYTVEYWMTGCREEAAAAADRETLQFNEAPLGYSRDDQDHQLKLFPISDDEKSKEQEAQSAEAARAKHIQHEMARN